MLRAQRLASASGSPLIEPERSSTSARCSGARGTVPAGKSGACTRTSRRSVVGPSVASAALSGVSTSLKSGDVSSVVGMAVVSGVCALRAVCP